MMAAGLTDVPVELMLMIAKQLPWSTLVSLLRASPEFLHLKGRCENQEAVFKEWMNWTVPYPTKTPSLEVADDCIKDDEVVVRAMLKKDPLCYEWASDRLKNDRQMALQAISMHQYNILHAPEELVRDKGFMTEVLNSVRRSYLCAPELRGEVTVDVLEQFGYPRWLKSFMEL